MATVKTTQKPASWKYFPGYKKFWDNYVSMFWGDSMNNSYQEMLRQDLDWLKKSYLTDDKNLTAIENKYKEGNSNADADYEREINQGTIPISFGGGPVIKYIPNSVRYSAEQKRKNRADTRDKAYDIGKNEAARKLEIGTNFTPNLASREYMRYLRGIGSEGQATRMGLSEKEEKAKTKGSGTMGKVSTGLGIAGSIAGLIAAM